MDVRKLTLLRELGDRGSVTAVAEAVFLTPSAVSQQLAALQRTVPVPLTRREGRRLGLTDAGRALAAAGVEVVTALARADAAVEAFLDDPHGTVRVSAFHSAAAAFFPALLSRQGAGRPTVACTDEDVAQEAFGVLTADHDVVIAHRSPHGPGWPASVTVTRLLDEPLDVALPVGHPLAERAELTAAEVADEPWIAVHEGFPLLGAIEAIGAAAGSTPRVAHRINDVAVAAAVVAAGGGLALVPRHTAPVRADVVLRPLRGVRIGRRVDALSRPERAARRSVATVLDDLVQIGHELER